MHIADVTQQSLLLCSALQQFMAMETNIILNPTYTYAIASLRQKKAPNY